MKTVPKSFYPENMYKILLRLALFLHLVFLSNISFAEKVESMPHRFLHAQLIRNIIEKDSASRKPNIKICSCQILALQSGYVRQKNFALFAERTQKKGFQYDISYANRAIEREKRHMKSMFYDKLEVIGTISDDTDCKSMFRRLKTKNKSLYLYDILDADIRR